MIKSKKGLSTYVEKPVAQENGYVASGVLDLTAAVPVDGNYLKLNGVTFTFRNSPSVDNDVAIGSDTSACIDNILAEVNLPAVAEYVNNGGILTITYKTIGTAGNNYTIACDYIGELPSSLSGGSDTPDADWAQIGDTTLNYKPLEIKVLSDSTNTALKMYEWNSGVNVGDLNGKVVKVLDGIDLKEGAISSSSSSSEGTASTVDVFGDGSCIALYEFEDNANDTSGNYNGTADANATYDTGKFGKALNTSATLDTTIPDSIFDKDKYATISMWINTTDLEGGFTTYEKVTEFISLVLTSDGISSAAIRSATQNSNTTNGDTYVRSGNDLRDGVWHHLVFKYDASYVYLYEDGVEYKTAIPADESKSNGVTLQFKLVSGSVLLDQVRIFNKALTADEVSRLYNESLLKYTYDISDLNLDNTPTKAWLSAKTSVDISTATTENECINYSNISLPIDTTTAIDGSNLVTNIEVKENQYLIVDDVKALSGSVTLSNGLYTILLTNHNLIVKPSKAYLNGGINLIKKSSTTTTFAGTSVVKKDITNITEIEIDKTIVKLTDKSVREGDLRLDLINEISQLTASDAAASDHFGISVALSNDGLVAMVGAYTEDTAATDAGKVYTYTRDTITSSWTEVTQLTASDAAASDQFGISVALSNDGLVAMVGAYTEDTAATDAGKVYTYTRDTITSSWTEVSQLTASDAAASDQFGISVALSNDGLVAMVGAYTEDTAATDAGKVYTYKRDTITSSWTEVSQLTASDAAASDQFGISVALSNDGLVAMVGAFYEDTAATDAGKVYTYKCLQDNIYTFNFADQSVAPTTCKLMNNALSLKETQDIYNSANNMFTKTFEQVTLASGTRVLQRKITVEHDLDDGGIEIYEPFQTDMYT